jgi:hypothetical protein
MFTLVCALPAAGVVPAAIAQEDTSLGEDLAGGIISDVLDGDADDEINQDATNTATVNPSQEQDVDQITSVNLEITLPTSALPM